MSKEKINVSIVEMITELKDFCKKNNCRFSCYEAGGDYVPALIIEPSGDVFDIYGFDANSRFVNLIVIGTALERPLPSQVELRDLEKEFIKQTHEKLLELLTPLFQCGGKYANKLTPGDDIITEGVKELIRGYERNAQPVKPLFKEWVIVDGVDDVVDSFHSKQEADATLESWIDNGDFPPYRVFRLMEVRDE